MDTELDVRGSSQTASDKEFRSHDVGELYKYYSHYCQYVGSMLMDKSMGRRGSAPNFSWASVSEALRGRGNVRQPLLCRGSADGAQFVPVGGVAG